MSTYYKRNAKGEPIFWHILNYGENSFTVSHGIVGKSDRQEIIYTKRNVNDAIQSAVNAKIKEGYKTIESLYDNAPKDIEDTNDLRSYLDTYLPKFNTTGDGKFIPMLCKTLEDNKPFEKGDYFGEWKINGERCIVTAEKQDDLFKPIRLIYTSRIGTDWTHYLSFMDDYILNSIDKILLDRMVEEGAALDGEIYLPGYGINEINSFIKNPSLPQHFALQYWVYDLAVENTHAFHRYSYLQNHFIERSKLQIGFSKDLHLDNTKRCVLLPIIDIPNITSAISMRDTFIDMGFEGLVIRKYDAEYQFGGKRNMSMLKFKKKEDGLFVVVDIQEDKRGLPIFTLKNDINDECFECTINQPQDVQRRCIINKDKFIGGTMLVEYRERSGIKQVPFHAKGIRFDKL